MRVCGETGKVAHHIRACMGQFAADAGFVDADGDGVCDNRADGSLGRGGYGFVDADGNGICDNRENGSYAGAGFVDADGDGVCDNRVKARAPMARTSLIMEGSTVSSVMHAFCK